MMGYLEMIVDLAPAVVVPVIYWIRTLQAKVDALSGSIDGVGGKIDRLQSENSREHGQVSESVSTLRNELVQEMRGVIAQHSEHDKQNSRIEVKLDTVLHETRKNQ